MPRKKTQPDLIQPTETTLPPEPPEPPKATTRVRKSRKTQVDVPLAVDVLEAPPAAPTAKPARAPRKKKSEPADVQEPLPELKEPGKGVLRRRHPKAAPVPAPTLTFDDLGDDMPMPIWRARTQPPAGTQRGSAPSKTTQAAKPRRGRKSEEPATIEVATNGEVDVPAEEPIAEPKFRERRRAPRTAPVPTPEPPKPVAKPIVPTPDDAPQIVLRDGVPTLVRNHRVYPPILFFGSSTTEQRAATVLEELKLAGEAGIHLHSHLIDFEVDPQSVDAAVSVAAYMLKKSVEIDPESQVLFRLVFQPPREWARRYPDAEFVMQNGTEGEPSVCDDAFWSDAAACLQSFVRKLRLLDLKDHVLGVHLDRGEWFMASDWGYDDSKAAQKKFREWASRRYSGDEVALRASWFDGTVRFDTIQVPKFMPEGDEGDWFVRSSRKQRRYVDYHLFLSDATVQRIGELAYAVKEAGEGYFIVGVSYGYTFEWSHPSSGHLSLGKLLRTPEIDFVAGPPSYRSREPGGAAPFPCPIDSFALNGKLYLSEADYKTSLSGGHEPDDFNPVIKTPQALDSVHWRGAGAALAHGSGVAWMDLWGTGWLKTPSIWDRGARVRKALIERMGCPLGEPEVVVFIDERALAYLVDQRAFGMLVQNVRESVLRAGVNAGFYLLSDLAHRERFPEAKLYLFLNAWDIRPDLRGAIKNRLQRDGKVLFWLYSAGLFDAGRDSLERAREVTGIALKPQPFHSRSGTTILARRHPLTAPFPQRALGGERQLEPSYFAIPEEAIVLGEYSQTGLPSFVVHDFEDQEHPDQNWTSVFLGEPAVNPALIRSLAQMAGAHVYNFQEDVVHVRPPFLTVHCTGTGPRSLTLPAKWVAYDLLGDDWVGLDHSTLRFTAIDGTTQVFLVGPQEELQHILKTNPAEVLAMAELPPKQDNQLRDDAFGFDVPIMKLDEWIEGADSDEMAEEWFLRPQQILEEPETESASAARRGRRRRRTERGGTEESGASARAEPSGTVDEEAGIGFTFRKR